MHLCCSNQIISAVLKTPNSVAFPHIHENWETLSTFKDLTKKSQIVFTQKGKITNEDFKGEISFLLNKNQILKEVQLKIKKPDLQIFKLLKPFESEKLCIGDRIKIGRHIVEVLDIYPECEHNVIGMENLPSMMTHQSDNSSCFNKCRVCFGSWDNDQDPLLNICSCAGTIKYTHLECLREWMMNKVRVDKKQNINYFQYLKIKCDICKDILPFQTTKNGIKYPLINYKKDYKNWVLMPPNISIFMPRNLVFEDSFSREESEISVREESSLRRSGIRNSKEMRFCVVLKYEVFSNSKVQSTEVIVAKLNPFTKYVIGKDSSDSNIIMKSPSVSKKHASLTMKNNCLYLEDLKSETGTFICLKPNREQVFQGDKGIILQHSNGQLIYLGEKKALFPFFSSNEVHRLKLNYEKKHSF